MRAVYVPACTGVCKL